MTVHMKPIRLSYLGPPAADVTTSVKVMGANEDGSESLQAALRSPGGGQVARRSPRPGASPAGHERA